MQDLESRARERRERKKLERTKQLRMRIGFTIFVIIIIIGILILARVRMNRKNDLAEVDVDITSIKYIREEPPLNVDLLDINEYSRPGLAIDKVTGIVVHYTANPGSTAKQNRDYFNNLAETHETHVSSQFIIGLDGEIIQCVPCNEIAYASNDRNHDTISIECCIEDESGKFNDKTYQSLIWLTAWLMGRYELSTDDIIRHYDVTGKNCPKYFVENEGTWEQFKQDLIDYIDTNGIEKELLLEENI